MSSTQTLLNIEGHSFFINPQNAEVNGSKVGHDYEFEVGDTVVYEGESKEVFDIKYPQQHKFPTNRTEVFLA